MRWTYTYSCNSFSKWKSTMFYPIPSLPHYLTAAAAYTHQNALHLLSSVPKASVPTCDQIASSIHSRMVNQGESDKRNSQAETPRETRDATMSSSAPRISARRQRWEPSSGAPDQGCKPEPPRHQVQGTSPHCFLPASLLLPRFLLPRCWTPGTEQSCHQP